MSVLLGEGTYADATVRNATQRLLKPCFSPYRAMNAAAVVPPGEPDVGRIARLTSAVRNAVTTSDLGT
jgi:hypothetical protein